MALFDERTHTPNCSYLHPALRLLGERGSISGRCHQCGHTNVLRRGYYCACMANFPKSGCYCNSLVVGCCPSAVEEEWQFLTGLRLLAETQRKADQERVLRRRHGLLV